VSLSRQLKEHEWALLEKAARIRSSQILGGFFSTMILLICNTCEIKIKLCMVLDFPKPFKK
jgi:hypothetical protein